MAQGPRAAQVAPGQMAGHWKNCGRTSVRHSLPFDLHLHLDRSAANSMREALARTSVSRPSCTLRPATWTGAEQPQSGSGPLMSRSQPNVRNQHLHYVNLGRPRSLLSCSAAVCTNVTANQPATCSCTKFDTRRGCRRHHWRLDARQRLRSAAAGQHARGGGGARAETRGRARRAYRYRAGCRDGRVCSVCWRAAQATRAGVLQLTLTRARAVALAKQVS